MPQENIPASCHQL